MGENIISWNIPNFVTIVTMVAVIWVVLGFASHLFRRNGGGIGGVMAGNLAGNGNVSGAEPTHISDTAG